MANQKYNAIKYNSTSKKEVVDDLVIEQALKIFINNEIFSITMCTPTNVKELALGLLYSEDIYKKKPSLIHINTKTENTITEIYLEIPKKDIGKGYTNSRSLLSVASCGICGKTDLQSVKGKVQNSERFNISELEKMFSI